MVDSVQYALSTLSVTISISGVQITPMVTKDHAIHNLVMLIDVLLPVIPPAWREIFTGGNDAVMLYMASCTKYRIKLTHIPQQKMLVHLSDDQ